MATLEEAVIALVQAQNEVRRLGKAIGDAINDSYAAQTENGGEYTNWLELAYKWEVVPADTGWGEDRAYVNHDGDVEAYLAEHDPHALRAHHLIQERKEARKRLGIARRRLSVMGKALIKKQEQHHDNQD